MCFFDYWGHGFWAGVVGVGIMSWIPSLRACLIARLDRYENSYLASLWLVGKVDEIWDDMNT